jgi:hypothetical protein
LFYVLAGCEGEADLGKRVWRLYFGRERDKGHGSNFVADVTDPGNIFGSAATTTVSEPSM